MNQQESLFKVSKLLSRFSEQVKILNTNGEFSINIHAENILTKILNIIYDCNLKNVNYEVRKTYPSIDLRDKNKRIAIQITATPGIDKIKKTISGYIANKMYEEYDNLYIYIITTKQRQYKQSSIDEATNNIISFTSDNIIDKTDIYKQLNAQNDATKIDEVCKLLESQFSDNKVELNKWEIYFKGIKEYDSYITNLYQYVDIKGFSPRVNNTLVKLSIEDIYVPLKFKYDYSNNAETKIPINKDSSYDIISALKFYNKIVILGDPGTGKSTSLKYLAHFICSHRNNIDYLQSKVPVYIKATDLFKYHDDTGHNLSEYIVDNTKYGLLFSDSLENNDLILLLDGLDEINITNQRHNMVDLINSFIAQYPEITIVVSSRKVGYKETKLSSNFFHFEVDQFSDDQILLFLKNWYSSIETYAKTNQKVPSNEANKLYDSIKQNRSVYRLARNPLLITIIALIYYQGNELPEKRVSLYEISTSTLLDNWVKLRPHQNNNIDRDALIELLAALAFHMHESNTTGLIPEKELKRILTNGYEAIHPSLELKEIRSDVKDIISFLREDAGFVFEKGRDDNGEALFGFVHLSFQEYFAAIEFYTRWKEKNFNGELKDYVYSYNWNEILKLTASLCKIMDPGRLGRANTNKFIKDIIDMEEILPGDAHRLLIVCQILNDEVEVEHDVLYILIEKLFVLLSEKETKDSHQQHTIYEDCLGLLIRTIKYKDVVIKYIIKRIRSNSSKYLSQSLINILMSHSDDPEIQDYLTTVLKSNDDEIKSYMFNYNVVLPLADIIKTDLFRSEIVRYINSSVFIKNYSGHLPTQYCCCFEGSMEEKLNSIRILSNEKMKRDLIDFYVFSWGMKNLYFLKSYYKAITKEYPDFKLDRINGEITKLERYESLGLGDHPIITIDKINLYQNKEKELKFAIERGENITIVDYPFQYDQFYNYFGEKASSIIQFSNMILTTINSETKEIIVNNDNDLNLLVNYSDAINWSTFVKKNKAIEYAISHLFNDDVINEPYLRWIINEYYEKGYFIKIRMTTDTSLFEESVKKSSLNIFDKLVLLKLIGYRFEDKEMIATAINEYKETKDLSKKFHYRKILTEVIYNK